MSSLPLMANSSFHTIESEPSPLAFDTFSFSLSSCTVKVCLPGVATTFSKLMVKS